MTSETGTTNQIAGKFYIDDAFVKKKKLIDDTIYFDR